MTENKPLSIPRNGLQLEVLLDGNVLDTNDGTKLTLTGTNIVFANTTVGYQKQHGTFDGSTSVVSVPADAKFLVQSIHWAGWVAPTARGNVLLYQTNGYASFNIGYSVALNSGGVYVAQMNGSAYTLDQYTEVTIGTDVFFFEAIYNGSSWKFYKNKDLLVEVSAPAINYSGGESKLLYIGKNPVTTAETWQSSIGTMRFYDRNLTEPERQSLYLEGKRMLGNYGAPDVMGKIGYVFESFGDDTLWETVAGTAVTRTAGTATTDNLGTARALTNPNYSWGSLAYSDAYSWENSGSGWNLAKNPTGVSATGINRTTTFRTLFLSTEALTADEEAQLAKLCEYSHPVRFTKRLPPSVKPILHLDGTVSGTTAYDQSGNGNNGTLVNSPTVRRIGQHKGWRFNGTTQRLTRTTNPFTSSEFTYSFKYSPVSLSGGVQYMTSADGALGTLVGCYFSDGTINFNFRFTGGYSTLTYTGGVTVGKIYAISLQKTASGLRMYLDGKLIASNATTGNMYSDTFSKFSIGSNGGENNFANVDIYDPTVIGNAIFSEGSQHLFHSTYIQ